MSNILCLSLKKAHTNTDSTMTMSLLLLTCSAALVSGMSTTTTSAPTKPGAEASLEEVWAWMSSVAGSQDQGIININMWMAGNKMSMKVRAK